MTDNEIIKALEYCINNNTCKGCPYSGKGCYIPLKKNSLDIINRQQAEIERLKAENEKAKNYLAKCFDKYEKTKIAKESLENTVYTARAEVIKEFAERLKALDRLDVDVSYGYGREHYTEAIAVNLIDNLVKEMVGEE